MSADDHRDAAAQELDFSDADAADQENRRWLGQLRDVLARVGWIVLVGIAIGVGLAAVGDSKPAVLPTIVSLAIKEIGMGLIVAAIAVFGYELLMHVSGVVTEGRKLRAGFQSLDRARKALDEALDRSDPQTALRRNLYFLFPEQDLRRPLRTLAEKALDLKKEPETAAGREYLKFLGWVIKEYAVRNAEQLANLHRCIQERNTSGRFEYVAKDTRVMASEMLAAQLRSLSRGDRYDSLANALFYKFGRMEEFSKAIEDASARGIRIRRIFNVANFDTEEKLRQSSDEFSAAKDIIEQNLRIARESRGTYQIRFFGRRLFDCKLIRSRYNHSEETHLGRFPIAFFGLFHAPALDGDILMAAGDESEKLARLTLSYCETDSPTARLFEDLWRLTDGAPNPFAGDRFDVHWLDAHCEALKQRGAAR